MSVTFVTLIDNDSFERGLKSTVKSRVKREHLYGNDWTLLGGEKGVEILHPCGKREIDMLKKWKWPLLWGDWNLFIWDTLVRNTMEKVIC